MLDLAWIPSDYFESLSLPQLLRGENDSKQSDEFQAILGFDIARFLHGENLKASRTLQWKTNKRQNLYGNIQKVANVRPVFTSCVIYTFFQKFQFPPIDFFETSHNGRQPPKVCAE